MFLGRKKKKRTCKLSSYKIYLSRTGQKEKQMTKQFKWSSETIN